MVARNHFDAYQCPIFYVNVIELGLAEFRGFADTNLKRLYLT